MHSLANFYIHIFTSGLTCILHAETGSGKTLAYLLPLLKRLINYDKTNTILPIQSLIIVPTKVTHSLTHLFIHILTKSPDLGTSNTSGYRDSNADDEPARRGHY